MAKSANRYCIYATMCTEFCTHSRSPQHKHTHPIFNSPPPSLLLLFFILFFKWSPLQFIDKNKMKWNFMRPQTYVANAHIVMERMTARTDRMNQANQKRTETRTRKKIVEISMGCDLFYYNYSSVYTLLMLTTSLTLRKSLNFRINNFSFSLSHIHTLFCLLFSSLAA